MCKFEYIWIWLIICFCFTIINNKTFFFLFRCNEWTHETGFFRMMKASTTNTKFFLTSVPLFLMCLNSKNTKKKIFRQTNINTVNNVAYYTSFGFKTHIIYDMIFIACYIFEYFITSSAKFLFHILIFARELRPHSQT